MLAFFLTPTNKELSGSKPDYAEGRNRMPSPVCSGIEMVLEAHQGQDPMGPMLISFLHFLTISDQFIGVFVKFFMKDRIYY